MAMTMQDLRDAMLAEIQDKKFDLVYVDYRDEMSDEQVNALVRGDFEAFDEGNLEWESDSRNDGANYEMESLFDSLTRNADIDFDFEDFRYSDEGDEVREAIYERDEGDANLILAQHKGDVLLRITCIDEDEGWSFEEVTAGMVLDAIGFEKSEHNRKAVQYALDNHDPEYHVTLGQFIVGADIAAIYKMPWFDKDSDYDVEIVNPYLYVGNPFAGNGMITEQPLQGIATVKRSDLRTDKDAFGYDVDNLYGGLYASQFESEVRKKA